AKGFAPRNDGGRVASTRNPRIEINPAGILLFDQTNLPIASPFLQFLLTRDRGDGVVVNLEPNQLVDAVSRRKAGNGLGPMLVNATHDVIGHAEIKRDVLPAREEIDVIGHLRQPWLWIPGSLRAPE